jgi:hypothetical protein
MIPSIRFFYCWLREKMGKNSLEMIFQSKKSAKKISELHLDRV